MCENNLQGSFKEATDTTEAKEVNKVDDTKNSNKPKGNLMSAVKKNYTNEYRERVLNRL